MPDKDQSAPLISRREALGLGAAASLALADASLASGKSPRPGLQSLGYAVMPGKDLDAWSDWAPKVFGLQLADRSADTRVFRMDDHLYRFALDRQAQVPTLGWEVADAGALDAMAARLEAAGVKVDRGSRALASQRGVRDLVTLSDPAGNGVEIYHGPALANSPFQPGRPIAGFKTGPLGLGHVVLEIERPSFEKTSVFYREVLGFRLSDYMTINGARMVEFLHVNPREHTLALGPSATSRVNHVMMEMQFMDDVGQAYDIVFRDYRSKIAATIGRHTNDLMTSFYVQTPSDFQMECGWGGLLVDSERWQARELTAGFDIWGHQFMKDGQPAERGGPGPFAPTFPLRPLRAPLQVSGKDFEVGHRPTELTQVLQTLAS